MKKQLHLYVILSSLFFLTWTTTVAQVTIVPTYPNSQIFKFDHLLQIRLVNTSNSTVNGYLELTIENTGSQTISTIRSMPMMLSQGGMQNSTNIRWEQNPQYGNSVASEIFSETGNLPYGEYSVCYRFIHTITQSPLGVHCLEKSSRPFGQPELLSPSNQAVIPTKHPLLTWRPPLPTFDTNVQYNLTLKEVLSGQQVENAIHANVPLLQLKNLSSTSTLYPTTATPLQTGKQYVWQVAAFFDGVEIGKTSIWVFKLQEEEVVAMPQTSGVNYATLKRKLGGGYYQVEQGFINFKIEEHYNTNTLTYKIYDGARNDFTPQTSLTTTATHKKGFNYHTISFQSTCGYNYTGLFFILEITTSSGEKYYLRIKYQDSYNGLPC